jgi:hypothetical protein
VPDPFALLAKGREWVPAFEKRYKLISLLIRCLKCGSIHQPLGVEVHRSLKKEAASD